MLYGRHLGFRGNFEKALADRDPGALELFNNMEEVKAEATKFMKVARRVAIFRGRARKEIPSHLFAPGARRHRNTFPLSSGSAFPTGCA